MNDGAWEGVEFVPYGGKLLVRLVCAKVEQVIGEIRTNSDLGPLLWYRVSVLRASLMSDGDELPVEESTPGPGLQYEQRVRYVVDRVSLRDGVRIAHMAEIPWGSKEQRGSRLRPLNENRSVIRLAGAKEIVEWALGCERCGQHSPDLADLLDSATEAAKGSGPRRFVV